MPSVRALTEAHRLAQLRLRSASVRDLLRLWSALDPQRLDETFHGWSTAVDVLVQQRYGVSAGIAGRYFSAVRAEAIGVAAPAMLGPGLPAKQRAITMLVSGPIAIKKLTARLVTTGLDPVAAAEQAAKQAFVLHSGAASRLILAGGRDTLLSSVRGDRRATGWQRVTSGNACDFCQMLEDRGSVYKDDTADFEAHNHCACSAEPEFA